jgi:hypothetical protein
MTEPVIHLLIDEDLKADPVFGPKPTADGTRFRASEALMCARQIGFRVIDYPEDLEIPAEVLLTFDVGNRFHERIQGIIERRLGGKSEVVASHMPDYEVSAHIDSLYSLDELGGFTRVFDENGTLVAVEIKTVSGYGYLVATGLRKSDEGAGPKPEHVAQAALGACAPNIWAQYIHLIYIDKDRQGIAEWILDMDEVLPGEKYGDMSPRDLALAELERSRGIGARLDDGKLPARFIPGYGRVEDPPPAGSPSSVQPWNCKYCRWQPTCKDLPSAPIPLAMLPRIKELSERTNQDSANAPS